MDHTGPETRPGTPGVSVSQTSAMVSPVIEDPVLGMKMKISLGVRASGVVTAPAWYSEVHGPEKFGRQSRLDRPGYSKVQPSVRSVLLFSFLGFRGIGGEFPDLLGQGFQALYR